MSERAGGEPLYTSGDVKALLNALYRKFDMMMKAAPKRDPATLGQRNKIPLPANTLGVHCDILWQLSDSDNSDEYKDSLKVFHKAQVKPRLGLYAKELFVVDDMLKNYLDDWETEAMDIKIDPKDRMKLLIESEDDESEEFEEEGEE